MSKFQPHNRLTKYAIDLREIEMPPVGHEPISIFKVQGAYHICQKIDGKMQAIRIEDRPEAVAFLVRFAQLVNKKGD